jgi:hypothetical protein
MYPVYRLMSVRMAIPEKFHDPKISIDNIIANPKIFHLG